VACVLLRSPQGAVLQCASSRSATARNRSGGRTGRRWWAHRLPDGPLLGTGLPARQLRGPAVTAGRPRGSSRRDR
jgi:hypothetical protein